MSTPSSRPAAERLPRDWWAHGLTLAERLAVADRPVASRVTGEREQRARRRLERWRAGHGLGTTEGFARRMAHAGLDDAGLTALLAEPRTSLGARASRPEWAGVVERAVASAPETSTSVGSGSEDSFQVSLAAFTVSLGAFIEDAVNRVRRGAPAADVDIAAVCEGFADQLAHRVVRLASRTLVLELNAARVTGRLRGETAQERFADFAGQLATGSGLATLVEEYPVLGRLIGQMCELAADSTLELLDRFAADRDAVVATLLHGVDPGPLVAVSVGGGDRHQRGRSVAMLRFAGGETIVYKPRSQQMQEYFGELVEWLNGKAPGLDLRVPAVLSRPGYGWVEFVAHRPCVDVDEVDRFYHRQGALLALLYAVDGTDIHYENLIAAGDQPILVDVETLFHPSIAPATATPDPAATALTSSVVRTALLPQLLLGDNGAMDISGLGGDKNATYPFDVVSFDSAGTDEMRLVRGPRQVPGADNRPRLGDADADPSAYQSALLVGFRTVYDVIVAHRSELVGQDGLLSGCADLEIRIIVRPTQTYATLLDESTHPDVLRDGLDRDSVFDLLWTDAAHDRVLRRLAPMEIADMWAGDVPMFVGRPTSRDVWTATGERVPNVLEHPSLDAVTAKIMAMCELDRLDQEWLITAALAARGQTVEHRSGNALPGQITASVPDSQRLLATACGIADELIARSRHDDLRANWLGIEPIDGRHWTVTPMGAGLADGYPGVALFLAQLGKLTGSARYLSLARKAINPIPRLLDVLADDLAIARAIGPGGFLGLGGICYALARLATLLDDSDIRSWLGLALELTGATDGPQTGLVAGRGGGLVAMLAVHAETGLPTAGKLATTFADRLLHAEADDEVADEVVPASGFAAGPAGVGYGLLRLAATGAGEKYAAAGSAAIERTEGPDAMLAARNYSWCTGLSGAVLARADLHDGQRENQLDQYLTALADHGPLRDTSLCHGELGAVEPLTVLATRGHEHAASVRLRSTARILGALDRYGPRCGTPDGVLSPGLLTGLAGIGYGLLRLGFAEDVPSVLLLEPTTAK